MPEVVIVSGVRTPIGSYGGALRDVPVYRLGALVLQAAVVRAGLEPGQVDDVICGQAYMNGECANAGRMALLEAGWPDTVPAVTLDRRCCSGLDAVLFGAMKIQTGHAEIVAACGLESMSQAELYLPGEIKWGLGGRSHEKWGSMPRGHGALAMWGIPFHDRIQRARVMSQPLGRYGELNSMMIWAEEAARVEGISREDADRWALRSHRKAAAAWESGRFGQEIVGVPLPARKGVPELFERDETPRADAAYEKLAALKAVYPDGVCTAGNSSSENDGAAAVVLASAEKARELGLPILARFVTGAVGACDPRLTYPAVAVAVQQALKKAGLGLDRIDLFEIQEAFAVQLLADAKLIGLAPEEYDCKINVNGSGISLGHPIGATGVMRLVTLIHEMTRRGSAYGLETICGGGGQGIAAILAGP
ncbi:MAG: thiolase family protein [Thermodesulfobacteriota bacterium]